MWDVGTYYIWTKVLTISVAVEHFCLMVIYTIHFVLRMSTLNFCWFKMSFSQFDVWNFSVFSNTQHMPTKQRKELGEKKLSEWIIMVAAFSNRGPRKTDCQNCFHPVVGKPFAEFVSNKVKKQFCWHAIYFLFTENFKSIPFYCPIPRFYEWNSAPISNCCVLSTSVWSFFSVSIDSQLYHFAVD